MFCSVKFLATPGNCFLRIYETNGNGSLNYCFSFLVQKSDQKKIESVVSTLVTTPITTPITTPKQNGNDKRPSTQLYVPPFKNNVPQNRQSPPTKVPLPATREPPFKSAALLKAQAAADDDDEWETSIVSC